MKKFFATLLLLFPLTMSTTPALAQGDTLTVGMTMGVKSLDPQGSTLGVLLAIAGHIGETLVRVENGKVLPLLAESWKLLDDKVTYEFTLKPNVKFHNGEIMTADDVVYTFQRALSPAGAGSRGMSMYLGGASKKDERTVYVKSVAPMGQAFLGSLSHPWASICNKKYTEALGQDYGQKPVGTGKFKFVRSVLGDRVELVRFDDYHGTPAKVKNLIFRAIVEASSRTIELESGAIDVAMDIAPIDVRRFQDNPKLDVVKVPSYRLYHLCFDATDPPYDNPKVREAINIAINRPGIIKAVFRGFGEPARGVLPPTVEYSSHKNAPEIPYDPAKAKKLLAEAGYPNGFKGVLMSSERHDYRSIAMVVQNNLREIGIDMQIRIIEGGASFEAMAAPKHPPFINNWGGNVPTSDPFFYLNPQFHSKSIGQTNRTYYKNPELDKLLEEAAQAPEGEGRAALYDKVWKILDRDLLHINILVSINLFAKTKNLKGGNFLPTALSDFNNAYFE